MPQEKFRKERGIVEVDELERDRRHWLKAHQAGSGAVSYAKQSGSRFALAGLPRSCLPSEVTPDHYVTAESTPLSASTPSALAKTSKKATSEFASRSIRFGR